MKQAAVLLFLLFFSSVIILAEGSKTLKGKVLDAQTSRPLEYVNIYLSEGNVGTITNSEGIFEIRLDKFNSELLISYLGYKTKILTPEELKDEGFVIVRLLPKDLLLQEVSVYNHRSSKSDNIKVSSLKIDKDQIEKISNAMPDVLRSFQALPGISANNEFSAEFNVRGGNKDENLIQVNGAQVYEPYHLKEAQNASVGVFNAELIERVNIVTGGFSARYGDRLSSVANIEYREGNREKYSGSATLSLAFLDGYAEGPFSDKGSFIIAARKTYMEYLMDFTGSIDPDIQYAEPKFYDVQGVISYDFNSFNKIKFSFLHSGDNWDYNPQSIESESSYSKDYHSFPAEVETSSLTTHNQIGNYYSTLFDLQSLNILSSSAFLNTKISYYNQSDHEHFITTHSFIENIEAAENYFSTSNTRHNYESGIDINTLEIETELDLQISPFYDLKSGISFKNVFYNQTHTMDRFVNSMTFTPEFPDTFETDYTTDLGHLTELDNARSYKYSAYIENLVQIEDYLLFNIAGRADYFDLNKELSLSPRLNLAYTLPFGTIFRAAWGHYYQSPIYTQLKSSKASDENTKSQMAIHYIAGIEQNLNLSKAKLSTLKLKIDLFYKDYKNLISSYYSHYDKLFYSRNNDATGYSQGIDFYALLNIPGFYTWVSYSYLLAMEDEFNDGKGAYPRLTGQKHTLAWITNFDLGNGWGMNTKFYYGSGYPYSEKILTFYEKTNEYIWETESTTTSYLPSYQRFDLRISKDLVFNSFTLKTFVEISNLFNHKNIRGYEYSYDEKGNPIVKDITLWPMLPSFGVKFEF